jgi:hypothetical protein
MDPMRNNYNKILLNFTSSRSKTPRIVKSLNSHFVGPKPKGFQAFFGLSWMLLGISHREWPLYTCWDYWELKDQWSSQIIEHWMKACHLRDQNSETYCKSKISARPLVQRGLDRNKESRFAQSNSVSSRLTAFLAEQGCLWQCQGNQQGAWSWKPQC